MTTNLEKELYKPVSKVHLSELMQNKSFPKSFTHAVVDGHGNILNFCSEKYNLTPNTDIFPAIEAELKARKMVFEKKIKIVDGAQFFVDYLIKKDLKEYNVGDIIPRLSIWNSYDGIIKYRRELGFHKLLCKNGLSRPTGKNSIETEKHLTALTPGSYEPDEIDFRLVGDRTVRFLEEVDQDMKIFRSMERKKADEQTILEISKKMKLSGPITRAALERFGLEIYGGSMMQEGDRKVFAPLFYETFSGATRKHTGSKRTLWTVYNALNWAIYNHNQKESQVDKLEKDVKLLKITKQLIA